MFMHLYFAHFNARSSDIATSTTTHSHTNGKSGIENPAVAFPLVTVAALVLMLGAYWLLKRFTSWQFPINKKGL